MELKKKLVLPTKNIELKIWVTSDENYLQL